MKLATLILALTAVRAPAAQTSAPPPHRHESPPATHAGSHETSKDSRAADPSHAVDDAMSGAMHDNPHLRMPPSRAATAADSVRADSLVREARVSLARYKDVRVAEREGYRMFAPNVKGQPVYHFTKLGAAIRERFRLDVAKPSSEPDRDARGVRRC